MQIIDALVVTLNLDPSQFTQGQKKAATEFLKLKAGATAAGKSIEESNKRLAETFLKVKNELVTLLAALLGARGVQEFVSNINSANLQLSRLAANLGLSPQVVSAFGMAVESLGGSAESAKSSLANLTEELYGLHAEGRAMPTTFYRLQTVFEKLTGQNFDTEHGAPGLMVQMAIAAKELAKTNPNQAFEFLKHAGIDDATAAVMIRVGGALKDIVAAKGAFAPSDRDLEATRKFVEQWTQLSQVLTKLGSDVMPVLNSFLLPLLNGMDRVLERLNNFNQGKLDPSSPQAKLIDDINKHSGQDTTVGKWLNDWLAGGAGKSDASSGGLTVDGRDVSKGNPLPVTIPALTQGPQSLWEWIFGKGDGGSGGSSSSTSSGGGFWDWLTGGGSAKAATQGGGSFGGANSRGEVQDFIRQAAIARGLNPDDMLRIVSGEGGFDPKWVGGGDDQSSFGPFQLHYGGISSRFPHSGLGDTFTQQTGLSAKTNETWRQQVEFALNYIAEHGFDPWKGSSSHSDLTGGAPPGAHAIAIHMPGSGFYQKPTENDYTKSNWWGGIGANPWQKLPTGAALSSVTNNHPVTTSSSSNQMHVGSININAPQAQDSDGIAQGISSSLANYGFAAMADGGTF